MKKRRILVTAVSGDIANGILKILRDAGEEELYGCDVNEIAVGMDQVNVFWQSRFAVDSEYIREILEKCRLYKITHLIPVNEREIEAISNQRHQFDQAGIRVLIQSEEILEICLDKYRTMEFLKKNGIQVPDTYIQPDKIPWKNGDSYVLKPRKSNGSKDIRMIHNRNDIDQSDLSDVLIQKYLDGEEYTVGIFRQGEATNIISFKRVLRAGYSYRVELADEPQLSRLAEKVADLFKLEGYINIQLRKQGGRYYIFEINPRISGTVRFRHMLGYDDVLWWLDMADGRNAPQYRNRYNKAVGIRELNEKFLVLEKKEDNIIHFSQ